MWTKRKILKKGVFFQADNFYLIFLMYFMQTMNIFHQFRGGRHTGRQIVTSHCRDSVPRCGSWHDKSTKKVEVTITFDCHIDFWRIMLCPNTSEVKNESYPGYRHVSPRETYHFQTYRILSYSAKGMFLLIFYFFSIVSTFQK